MHGLSWEPLCEPNFMYFCIKSCIGTQGKVGRCKAVVPVLLFVVCGLFYEAICFMSYLSCVFQSF